jgi:hypothetical protein
VQERVPVVSGQFLELLRETLARLRRDVVEDEGSQAVGMPDCKLDGGVALKCLGIEDESSLIEMLNDGFEVQQVVAH